MRKLVYFVGATIDGFIAGPNGELDFFPLEGDHIRAQIEELPETLPVHVREALAIPTRLARFDAVVMGRATYDPALAIGVSDPYAPLTTVVFSKGLAPRHEGRLRITADDPVAVVREMKAAEGRDIWLCGGGTLAGQLAPEIDELVVKVYPVLAVDGIRLAIAPFAPRKLELEDVRRFSTGVVWLTYRVVR